MQQARGTTQGRASRRRTPAGSARRGRLPPRDCIGETSVPSDQSRTRCRGGNARGRALRPRQLDRVDDDVLAGAGFGISTTSASRLFGYRSTTRQSTLPSASAVRHDRDLAAEPAGARQAVPHRRRRERPRLVEVAARRRSPRSARSSPLSGGARPGSPGAAARSGLRGSAPRSSRAAPRARGSRRARDDQRGGCHDRHERRRPRQAASLPRYASMVGAFRGARAPLSP